MSNSKPDAVKETDSELYIVGIHDDSNLSISNSTSLHTSDSTEPLCADSSDSIAMSELRAPSNSNGQHALDRVLSSFQDLKSNKKKIVADPIRRSTKENVALRKELEFCIEQHAPDAVDGKLFWWPWPLKDQKVPLPNALRKLDDKGKDDMSRYHCCHLWWCSFICCGADYSTLSDLDENGKLEKMCEETPGWEYPPPGRERPYDVNLDIEIYPDFKNYGKSKITINTFYDWMYIPQLLKYFWHFKVTEPFIVMLALFLVLPPFIWISVLYGLPKWGEPTSCNHIGWASVWAVFTNPLTEVTIAFCHAVLMFSSLDDTLPWRPAKFYFITLLCVYLTQVAAFLPLALTHNIFPALGSVSQLLRLVVELIGFEYNKKAIMNYAPERKNIDKDKMEARWKAFRTYIIFEFVLVLMYTAYIYGIKHTHSGAQTGLNLGFTLITILCRVFLQNLTNVFHKDMNFLLTFVLVYGLKASFTAFVSPNFGSSTGAYISSAITPIQTILFCFAHQSDLWFRFRCYIKKAHFLFTKRMPLNAFPIKEDMNFQGRGSHHDQPAYKRTKIHNDIVEVYAQICGYVIYLFIVPILRYGWNKNNFPYQENNPFLDQNNVVGDGFDEHNFRTSIYFSLLNCGYLLVGLVLFTTYLRKFYPTMRPVYREFLSVFWRHTWKLGALLMLVTIVNISVLKMVSSYSRMWWADEIFNIDCP